MAIATDSEEKRLGSLQRLRILDTPREERFDIITRLAQRVFNVSSCALCFTDDKRRWVKSAHGLTSSESPRNMASLCEYVIENKVPLIVQDTRTDPRFDGGTVITCKPYIRFYAAYPIKDKNGLVMGTLCLMDTSPHMFTVEDIAIFADLARMIEGEICEKPDTHITIDDPAIDSVTGVFNHAAIRKILKYKLSCARNNVKSVAVIMADLDRFKEVSDKCRHKFCDEILKEVAVRIESQIDPKADAVGRYGDDSFLIVVYDCDLTVALAKADAMRRAVVEKSFVFCGEIYEERLWGTISLGVAATSARELCAADEDSIIRCAEAALHKAKSNGRNRVESAK